MEFTKNSRVSCERCQVQVVGEQGRTEENSDPCSPQFRVWPPSSHTGSSSLEHWIQSPHSFPEKRNFQISCMRKRSKPRLIQLPCFTHLTPIVPFHYKLMSSCNKGEPICMVELSGNILPKCVTSPPGRNTPATSIIWIWPKKITHGSFMWNLNQMFSLKNMIIKKLYR